MQWITECLTCNNFVYILGDMRIKCSVCNKKTSMHKINKIITLISIFISDESALSCSKRLNLSYISVQKYYKNFRLLCAKICEEEYEQLRDRHCEYEEYFYLENSKKSNAEAIFDAHNFLTFDYGNHIYTLLMPSLKPYKEQFLHDNVEGAYINEFKKFKRDNKIIKVSERYNNIVRFWDYFEEKITHYKGVNSESFVEYLKEYEYKYNHTRDRAIDLLIIHYFKDL